MPAGRRCLLSESFFCDAAAYHLFSLPPAEQRSSIRVSEGISFALVRCQGLELKWMDWENIYSDSMAERFI
jgi:hypothetical protein